MISKLTTSLLFIFAGLTQLLSQPFVCKKFVANFQSSNTTCYCENKSSAIVLKTCEATLTSDIDRMGNLSYYFVDIFNYNFSEINPGFELQFQDHPNGSKVAKDPNITILVRLETCPTEKLLGLTNYLKRNSYFLEGLWIKNMSYLNGIEAAKLILYSAKTLRDVKISDSFGDGVGVLPLYTQDGSMFVKLQRMELENNTKSIIMDSTLLPFGTEVAFNDSVLDFKLDEVLLQLKDQSEEFHMWFPRENGNRPHNSRIRYKPLTGGFTSENYKTPIFYMDFNQTWNLSQIELYPPMRVRKGMTGTAETVVLTKSTFQFVKQVESICLPNTVKRMEFGAIGIHRPIAKSIAMSCLENSLCCENNVTMTNTLVDLWNKSDCVGMFRESLQLFVCQICLMEKYGMHRDWDQTASICTGALALNHQVLDCFWTPIDHDSRYLTKMENIMGYKAQIRPELLDYQSCNGTTTKGPTNSPSNQFATNTASHRDIMRLESFPGPAEPQILNLFQGPADPGTFNLKPRPGSYGVAYMNPSVKSISSGDEFPNRLSREEKVVSKNGVPLRVSKYGANSAGDNKGFRSDSSEYHDQMKRADESGTVQKELVSCGSAILLLLFTYVI